VARAARDNLAEAASTQPWDAAKGSRPTLDSGYNSEAAALGMEQGLFAGDIFLPQDNAH
jgi:hypothetical protein